MTFQSLSQGGLFATRYEKLMAPHPRLLRQKGGRPVKARPKNSPLFTISIIGLKPPLIGALLPGLSVEKAVLLTSVMALFGIALIIWGTPILRSHPVSFGGTSLLALLVASLPLFSLPAVALPWIEVVWFAAIPLGIALVARGLHLAALPLPRTGVGPATALLMGSAGLLTMATRVGAREIAIATGIVGTVLLIVPWLRLRWGR